MPGPLAGVRVVDLSRNAPGPYASMLLADLGAEVVTVTGGRAGPVLPEVSRGKRFVELDLKSPGGRQALHLLLARADVLIEGFRPGVAERLGAGWAETSRLNPGLVHCSLTGYGREGPLAQAAGHDINYLALAGFLGMVGPSDGPPVPPLNAVADLAGGSLVAAFGIVAALFRRQRTGRGEHLDVAMIDGVLSLLATWFPAWDTPLMPQRGGGLVAGEAPFYRCYACADGRFVAVGAIEPQFFAALWDVLGLDGPVADHLDPAAWPELTRLMRARLLTRTRDEWAALADGRDACLTPVLEPDEVWDHPHVRARHPQGRADRVPVVPAFADTAVPAHDVSDRTAEVLADAGADAGLIARVLAERELTARNGPAGGGLRWPPLAGP